MGRKEAIQQKPEVASRELASHLVTLDFAPYLQGEEYISRWATARTQLEMATDIVRLFIRRGIALGSHISSRLPQRFS